MGAGAAAVATVGVFCFFRDFSAKEYIGLAAAVFVGGLAPDLDIGSIPARWFGRIGFLFAAAFFGLGVYLKELNFLIYSALPGMLALLLMAMKHRGPTHKHWLPVILLFMVVFGSFPDPFAPALMICFAVGLETHLALDMIFPWSLKGWIP
jgi:hypothetical protein